MAERIDLIMQEHSGNAAMIDSFVDQIARLRAVATHFEHDAEAMAIFPGMPALLRKDADALVRLRQERDDWKESRGEWVDRALQAEQKRDDLQAIVDCLTAEHDEYRRDQQQYLFHLEGAVDRLTEVVLREKKCKGA